MQIVETTNEGLKRAYALTISAANIAARIEDEVKKIAPQVRMPGFRPGKVPANLVRKMHGEALHGDALNATVRESVDGLLAERKLRPAFQPRVELAEGYEQGKDAELTVEFEILPDISAPALDGLKLEKLVVPVADEAVDEALATIAKGQKNFEAAPDGHKAGDGDQLIIDFVGKLDGEVFEGGSAEGQPLEIGAGQFIPGFEEQLAGAKAGEERSITVTFPEDYPAEHLKGKEAIFDITVHEVKTSVETVVDEGFAESLGLANLETLKGVVRGQLEQETAGLTRTQMKRQLLDTLAGEHDFAVPPSMVDAEFEQIWAQLEQEAAKEEDPEAARKEIEDERDEYRKIAERRVRLGLLLSEIGQENKIEVSAQEMEMVVRQAAQQYRPEDRDRFLEYVQQDPMMAAQLRAPLYEEKVVDFLFDKAEVTEREVTREELQAAIEAEDTTKKGAEAKKKPTKKPAAKKAATKADEAEKSDAKPAKKPAAKKATAKAGEADAKKPAAKKPAAKKAATKADGAEAGKSDAKPAKKPAAKKATAKAGEAETKKPAAKKAAAKPAEAKAKEPKKPAAKKAPAKKAAE